MWAAIGAAFAFGVIIGLFVSCGLDLAELAAYRRIVRRHRRGDP